jgi:fucose 4-O-acetylase-like acetyltransferase
MNNRIIEIDRLKGFAIFLVVIGHLIQNNLKEGESNSLFSIIYSFHMPLFFFLSGYVAYSSTKVKSINSFIAYLHKKAVSLLIPMLSWPFIRKYLFTNSTDFNFSSILENLVLEISNPGLWFLKMLFQIYFIYSLFHIISDRYNEMKKITFDTILFLCFLAGLGLIFLVIKDYEIVTFSFNFSFFMFGLFIFKFKEKLKFIKNYFFSSSLVLIFLILIGHYDFNNSELIQMKIIKVIISTSGIISLLKIFEKIKLPHFVDINLIEFGKKSLVIYVTHFSFFQILGSENLIDNHITIPLLLLIIIPTSLILMSFCVALSNIVAVFPFLNLLFYGAPMKKRLI